MFTSNYLSVILQRVMRRVPFFLRDRLATVTLDNAEYLSLMGLSYYYNFYFSIQAGSEVWFQFTAPADRDVQVLLRDLSPSLAGVKYELYEGTEGFTPVGLPLVCRRNNPLAGVSPLSVVQEITIPSTAGVKIDTLIYIGEGGANNANSRSGGTRSADNGLRTYARGTGFFARIPNISGGLNAGRFRMEFAEMNEVLLRA